MAICTQILITEAAYDLKILFKAGNHKELLKDLRRLRQCIELPCIEAAWHEKITRPLGCALAEHRCLNLQKSIAVEEVAHQFRHAVTQDHIRLHLWAAQIEITVTQTNHLVYINAVLNIERGGFGFIENVQLAHNDLHFPRLHMGVYRILTACTNSTAYGKHKLRAQ